jgi:hypothetical protein
VAKALALFPTSFETLYSRGVTGLDRTYAPCLQGIDARRINNERGQCHITANCYTLPHC